jgi:hypothetical protein
VRRRASQALVLVAATAAAGSGCAGGTPQPALVKRAARDWAADTLHPATLMVTLVVVTPDEQRGRVRLTADGTPYDVRLGRDAGGDWRVTGARRS